MAFKKKIGGTLGLLMCAALVISVCFMLVIFVMMGGLFTGENDKTVLFDQAEIHPKATTGDQPVETLWSSSDPSLVANRDDVPSAFYPQQIHLWQEIHLQTAFGQFMTQHKKTYVSIEEKQKRYGIFKANLYYIHAHNAQGHSYSLAINKFGDLTREEFRLHSGLAKRSGFSSVGHLGVDWSLAKVPEESLPNTIDWREKGCVTPVKDQGPCGSCWAFSSTGALEGAWCAKTGKLISLSEQQLMDCSTKEGNHSCQGGMMDFAFDYVLHHGGICKEASYPYKGKDSNVCQEKKCENVVQVGGFYDVPPRNELALKAALFKHGPVSVGIDASQAAFQFYSKGVFGAECGTDLDHGVLIVGYGKDEKSNRDYFIMKNSWGQHWGDGGYMYMAQHKGKEGECGVLLMPSYPMLNGEEPVGCPN